MNCILENIMEITAVFGGCAADSKLNECRDSVSYWDQLKDVIIYWAKEFEDNYEDDDEYLVEIEVFAMRKFSEMGWMQESEKLREVKKEKLSLDSHQAARIDALLSKEPGLEEACMGEDETLSWTIDFGKNIQMDIKICGVQYREGESNLPWTEAVLFDHGSEVCCSEPSNQFFGRWELTYDNVDYSVNITRERLEEKEDSQGTPADSSDEEAELLLAKRKAKSAPEILTAGLLKSLSEGRNIPALESFLQDRSDDEELSLMNRGDYIATKVWQREDIEACLEENDYPVTEENVQRVLSCKMLNALNDCTGIDWGIFEEAIKSSACAYNSFMLLRELKEKWLRLEAVHGSTGADFMFETYLIGNPIPAVPEDTSFFDERDMETFLNDFVYHLNRLMDPKVYGDWSDDHYKYTRKYHGEKSFNEIENPDFIEAVLSEVLKMIPAIKEDGPFAIALYDLHDKIVYFESEKAAKEFMALYAVEYAVTYQKESGELVEVGEIYIEVE